MEGLVGGLQAFLYRSQGLRDYLFLWEHMDMDPLDPQCTLQLWKVTYANTWTHNPDSETLPLWVPLFVWLLWHGSVAVT